MALLLAPMEGLLDHTLRDILTRVGGVDRCVSEFIRVTSGLLPARAFSRIVPELKNGGRTRAGVPVRAQLLGSDPVCLAENAARLAELGPAGIDLNFGCPAKTVNQHRGGAVLLDEPELIARIVSAEIIAITLAQALGRGILGAAPWLMKGLSVAGTAAMFLVGGGILTHGLRPLQHGLEALDRAAGALVLAAVTLLGRLRQRRA